MRLLLKVWYQIFSYPWCSQIKSLYSYRDVHELSMAEENYGFASDSSTLALVSVIAAVVFSVTFILSAFVLFSILTVEECVNLIPYCISLHCKQWL